MIGFRDDVEKLSSNFIGGFQISHVHLKIFSQILLATTKIRLCEIIYLFSSVWNFDALGIPHPFQFEFKLLLVILFYNFFT